VCGKAACTDLGEGRAMKRTSLLLQRREFITLLSGVAARGATGAYVHGHLMARAMA
jgi:hypothetical protein